MRSLYAKRPLSPDNPRTFTVAALTILGLLGLVFASFEAGSTIRDVVVGVAYFCGATLATFALWRAALGPGAGRGSCGRCSPEGYYSVSRATSFGSLHGG